MAEPPKPKLSPFLEKIKDVDKYELGKTLGQGSFGRVKLAVNKEDKSQVAIKVMDRTSIRDLNLGPQIKEEIRLMSKINHPNIVRLLEVLASKKTLFIVMELVTGGELMKRIVEEGKFSESKARKYFRQLIEGLEHCHSHGVCHRDLKPENLLLDDSGNLKISDFGLAAALYGAHQERQLLRTTCGSPNYVAPEVLLDKGYDGEPADIWSAGVILYVLVAGFLPFDEQDMIQLFRKIMQAKLSFPKELSPEIKSLITGILNPDPTKRMKIPEIKKHAWFNEGEEEKPPEHPKLKKLMSLAGILDIKEVKSASVEYDDQSDDDEYPEDPPSAGPDKEKPTESTESSTETTESSASPKESSTTQRSRRLDVGAKPEEEVGEGEHATGEGAEAEAIDDSPEPSRMNAFDLINMVGGAAVSRMFVKKDERATIRKYSPNFTQFPSSLSAEALLYILEECLKTMEGLTCNFNKKKCWAEIKGILPRGPVDCKIQIYEMTPSLRLVEFRRVEGDEITFNELYSKLKKLVDIFKNQDLGLEVKSQKTPLTGSKTPLTASTTTTARTPSPSTTPHSTPPTTPPTPPSTVTTIPTVPTRASPVATAKKPIPPSPQTPPPAFFSISPLKGKK